MMSGTSKRSCCASAGGTYQNGQCTGGDSTYQTCLEAADGANSAN